MARRTPLPSLRRMLPVPAFRAPRRTRPFRPRYPDAPTAVSGTSFANGQSVVTWTAASNGGSAITGYTVQYSFAVAPLGYIHLKFAHRDSPYGYWPDQWNHLRYSGFRPPMHWARVRTRRHSATATPATTPGVPTAVSGTTHANAQSVVSWTAPASNNGAAITAYTVQYAPRHTRRGQPPRRPPRRARTRSRDLTNGTSYEFEVAATNGAGTGSFSALRQRSSRRRRPGRADRSRGYQQRQYPIRRLLDRTVQ